jgi:hypothetical protein
MYHDIGAMVQGILNVRAHEGVVHNHHDAVLMRNRRDLADVHQRQGRVRRRLDPDELCVGANELSDVNLDARAECNLDIVGQGYLGKVAVGSSVDV